MEPIVLFWIGLAALAILIVWVYYRFIVKPQEAKIAVLKEQYQKALKDGNRALALQLGREYYALKRGGALTIYDEQAITNDLSTIQ